MDKTINQYINQLHLDPKKEAAVRKIIALGGGSGSSMVEITYNELKELKDNAKLTPGCKYRMLDYETTTSYPNTQSAGHYFDLILTALDEQTLDEKCNAIWSKRDVDGYFNNSNLAAWEVRYCLDNDSSRFGWAIQEGEYIIVEQFGQTDKFKYTGEIIYNGQTYFKWQYLQNPNFHILTNNKTSIPTEIFQANIQNDEIIEIYEGQINFIEYVTETGGKGIIYYLKDEHNNICHYDFKNIKYNLQYIELPNMINKEDFDFITDKYVYTFNLENDDSDATVNSNYIRDCFIGNNNDLPFIIILNISNRCNINIGNKCYNILWKKDFYNDYSQDTLKIGNYSNNIFLYNSINNYIGNNCSNIYLYDSMGNIINHGSGYLLFEYVGDTYVGFSSHHINLLNKEEQHNSNYFGNNISGITITGMSNGNYFGNELQNIKLNAGASHTIIEDNCWTITSNVHIMNSTIRHNVNQITLNNAGTSKILNWEIGQNNEKFTINVKQVPQKINIDLGNFNDEITLDIPTSIGDLVSDTTHVRANDNKDIMIYKTSDIYNAIQATKA